MPRGDTAPLRHCKESTNTPRGSIPQQRFVANGVIINGNAKKDGIDTFRFGGVPIGSVGHWERHEIASFVADGKVRKGFSGRRRTSATDEMTRRPIDLILDTERADMRALTVAVSVEFVC